MSIHVVCKCDPDRALCGAAVPGDCWAADEGEPDRECMVCLDLEFMPCERCGFAEVRGGVR